MKNINAPLLQGWNKLDAQCHIQHSKLRFYNYNNVYLSLELAYGRVAASTSKIRHEFKEDRSIHPIKGNNKKEVEI